MAHIPQTVGKQSADRFVWEAVLHNHQFLNLFFLLTGYDNEESDPLRIPPFLK